LAISLLAASVAHTPEAEEVLRGARMRMARKPSAVARELLRNFPRSAGKRRRRRGRRSGAADDGARAARNGADLENGTEATNADESGDQGENGDVQGDADETGAGAQSVDDSSGGDERNEGDTVEVSGADDESKAASNPKSDSTD
jgi:hypothetical protein